MLFLKVLLLPEKYLKNRFYVFFLGIYVFYLVKIILPRNTSYFIQIFCDVFIQLWLSPSLFIVIKIFSNAPSFLDSVQAWIVKMGGGLMFSCFTFSSIEAII